ncbi:MAG: hypothetical protein E7637_07000 [Ruminococcaceae bacterium]|nr:hypothetical protein [Oscillospiraceae bacterium]
MKKMTAWLLILCLLICGTLVGCAEKDSTPTDTTEEEAAKKPQKSSITLKELENDPYSALQKAMDQGLSAFFTDDAKAEEIINGALDNGSLGISLKLDSLGEDFKNNSATLYFNQKDKKFAVQADIAVDGDVSSMLSWIDKSGIVLQAKDLFGSESAFKLNPETLASGLSGSALAKLCELEIDEEMQEVLDLLADAFKEAFEKTDAQTAAQLNELLKTLNPSYAEEKITDSTGKEINGVTVSYSITSDTLKALIKKAAELSFGELLEKIPYIQFDDEVVDYPYWTTDYPYATSDYPYWTTDYEPYWTADYYPYVSTDYEPTWTTEIPVSYVEPPISLSPSWTTDPSVSWVPWAPCEASEASVIISTPDMFTDVIPNSEWVIATFDPSYSELFPDDYLEEDAPENMNDALNQWVESLFEETAVNFTVKLGINKENTQLVSVGIDGDLTDTDYPEYKTSINGALTVSADKLAANLTVTHPAYDWETYEIIYVPYKLSAEVNKATTDEAVTYTLSATAGTEDITVNLGNIVYTYSKASGDFNFQVTPSKFLTDRYDELTNVSLNGTVETAGKTATVTLKSIKIGDDEEFSGELAFVFTKDAAMPSIPSDTRDIVNLSEDDLYNLYNKMEDAPLYEWFVDYYECCRWCFYHNYYYLFGY